MTARSALDDSDLQNFTFHADATNGVLLIDPNGVWTYTPNTNFNGTDTFTIAANDHYGHVHTQVITITVNPVDDPATFEGDTSGTGYQDPTNNGR